MNTVVYALAVVGALCIVAVFAIVTLAWMASKRIIAAQESSDVPEFRR